MIDIGLPEAEKLSLITPSSKELQIELQSAFLSSENFVALSRETKLFFPEFGSPDFILCERNSSPLSIITPFTSEWGLHK